ncbi:hypothetical protein H920_00204 [Fukomys damarensis]|uniref:Uncharacterized protein n=1 Tax=Fukomys damarensis TaxID=885580 RepID=A0A091E6Z0_FUKDA|nr:hypothetical protein H920_00204 [Fukomys damarensis]
MRSPSHSRDRQKKALLGRGEAAVCSQLRGRGGHPRVELDTDGKRKRTQPFTHEYGTELHKRLREPTGAHARAHQTA